MAEVTAHDEDTLTRVAVTGRLDLQGVQALELTFTAHTAAAKKPAVVDLSGVEYIASLGLRMLSRSRKSFGPRGSTR